MSKFSHEHHILLLQDEVINSLYRYSLIHGYDSMEIIDLPASVQDREKLLKSNQDLNLMRFIVGPSDLNAWSIIFSEWDYNDEEIVSFLSEDSNSLAIYGHNNDQVDNWRWIILDKGQNVAEYWYTGQKWARFPKLNRPEGALTIGEAFESKGRSYNHWTFEQILKNGDEYLKIPISQFKLASFEIN